MRLRFRRRWLYAPLVAALLLLGVFAGYSAFSIRAASLSAERLKAATGWPLIQARLELARFREAAARYMAGDGSMGFDEVVERFDILWSRIPILSTEMPVAVEVGGVTLADAERDARGALQRVEAVLQAAGNGGDRRRVEEALRLLDPIAGTLQDLLVAFQVTRQRLHGETQAGIRMLARHHQITITGFFGVVLVLLGLAASETWTARRARARAVAGEERFRHFAGSASDWLWEIDDQLRFTYVSGHLGDILGRDSAQILGRCWTDFVDAADEPQWRAHLADLDRRRPFRNAVYGCRTATGEPRTFQVSGSPVADASGRFLGYRGVGSDITDRLRQERRIQYLARHDPLTGLANRAALQEDLGTLIERARSRQGEVALLLIDLDGFKAVNDSRGHNAGDHLLQRVAERLLAATRRQDLVARLGGDEFAVVTAVTTDAAVQAKALADRLVEALSSGFAVDGRELRIGCSIGIARFPADGSDGDEVLKAADLALYRAKQSGRGCHRSFTAEMAEELRARRSLEEDLRHAIERGELDLHYQPLVRIADRRLAGAEALLRWDHRQHGAVAPGVFVRLAEETGLILPLGRLALTTACRDAAGWRGRLAGLPVSVNVSLAQFASQDFPAEVRQALRQTGLPPSRLVLEITETVLMLDQRRAVAVLEELRQLGVRLAIDDFGTGYSSLAYLRRFPVHELKLDRSFINDLEQDESDRKIVEAMIMLGRSLGLETVAEGVETQAQLSFLAAAGCHTAQGFLLARPMANADLERMPERWGKERRSGPHRPLAGASAGGELVA